MADYDVVIIGSGVAGALCAAGLAGDSRKILVLEAAENSLGVFQREQFKRTWDPATRKTWNTPYLSTTGIRNYPSPVSDDINTYFDQPDVDPNDPDATRKSLTTFKGTYQRLAGGSTWAWRGNTPRMQPNDLRIGHLAQVREHPAEVGIFLTGQCAARLKRGRLAGHLQRPEALVPQGGI